MVQALFDEDYAGALTALRKSLLELEPNKQLSLLGFSNNLRKELLATGKTGEPLSIYTAMITGLKSIKQGSQQPDNNTLRELYFEHLDATSQSIMIHIKKDHDRSDSSWQQFHRVVLETLKDLNITRASQPKQVMIAVEPTEVATTKQHQERRGRDEHRGRDEQRGREEHREHPTAQHFTA